MPALRELGLDAFAAIGTEPAGLSHIWDFLTAVLVEHRQGPGRVARVYHPD